MYPVFLKLADRKCLVVGGGKIAARKADALLRARARVTVVALEPDEQIKQWAAERRLELLTRIYSDGEAAAYFLVVAATNNRATNAFVYNDAESAGRLVNTVDDPKLCNFFLPAIVSRGDLEVAVSTGGLFPTLAKKVKADIDAMLPDAYSRLVPLLHDYRQRLMRTEPDPETRKRRLNTLLTSPECAAFLQGDTVQLTKRLLE